MKFALKLAAGFLSPLVGFWLIVTDPALRRLSFAPFLITALIFIVGLALGLPFLTSLVAPFSQWLVTSLHLQNEIVKFLLPLLIWPALALALIHSLLILTRLIASPFYSLLAERVLGDSLEADDQRERVWSRFVKQARALKRSMLRALFLLVLGLILGVLSFIPGFGLLTSFAFLVLLAYDVIDYSLDALALDTKQRIEFFRHQFAVFLGLGAMLGVVFLIPGLNFFVLPAAVAGASNLVRRSVGEGTRRVYD